jgi:ribosomal protein S18 acetylase RimI-like enzyme
LLRILGVLDACPLSAGYLHAGGRSTATPAMKQSDRTGTTIGIRPGTAADTARIRAIALSAYAKYVPRIGRAPAPMAADYEAEIAAGHVAVIEAAGTLCGYMIAWPEPDAFFIDNIAVDPAFQRSGLGRRLIDHATAEAERLGLPALRLYTNVQMTENLSMYRHLGFVETHRAVEQGFHRVYLRRQVVQPLH